jgi:hypothetical protein
MLLISCHLDFLEASVERSRLPKLLDAAHLANPDLLDVDTFILGEYIY